MNKQQLEWAHPLVREWFEQRFGVPTAPQLAGWPAILAGLSTLISAPTGSGKTFAAFLTCIDRLVRQACDNTLTDATEVLYVSPLKALSNDIHKNLTEPLTEITALAASKGMVLPEIRVAVRTGDTLAKERQAMLKQPPHILVTTPESLYILLTAEKSRLFLLSGIKTLIVDEIHALANDKRGAHLTLSIERLEALLTKPPVRIGLSATQKPMEQVARFLVGAERALPHIVNLSHMRNLELTVHVPGNELGPVASNELWDEMYDAMANIAMQNRSTLIFVNTRRLAERVAHHLAERLGEDQVLAHHGSLSRKIRLHAEHKLKNGELKALVATASLELGIDIGSIDVVCQIGSPRAIATALQRIGRAGHWHGAISKATIFATTLNELLECAALVYAIKTGDLDQLIMPEQPIDILAQQIVAACATQEWSETALFNLVRRAYPYASLTRETFERVISMLSDGIAGSRGRYGAYLFRDQVNGMLKARRGARLTAITSGGAIPDNGLFTVIAEPNGLMVGTLDEDFAVESNRGDIILLGSTSWMIKRVEGARGRVLVEDAHGAPPSVPFWRGEAPARSNELSLQVSDLRQRLADKLPAEVVTIDQIRQHPQAQATLAWLQTDCGLNESGAEQLVTYVCATRAVLGAIPTQNTIIAERFFDEAGGMQLIIHAPFGARINKAWGLALRKKFCRSFNFELQAAATDDGINIALAEQHSFPLADVFQFCNPKTIAAVLVQAVLQSPLFPTRWRWTATRALALVRFRGGKKVPPNIQRMLSDDLLAAVFPDAAACQDNLGGRDIELPDHPLIDETMKDALTQALDTDGLVRVLEGVVGGGIQCLAVDTTTPSAFSHEILNANPYAYLDDAPLEERRARAVTMRRVLPAAVLEKVGQLDAEIIREVQGQAWPDVRNADELHDVLQTVYCLPLQMTGERTISLLWREYFATLVADKRATEARVMVAGAEKVFWVCAERLAAFTLIHPDVVYQQRLKEMPSHVPDRNEAVLQMLRGWFLLLGPTTAHELQQLLSLPLSDIEHALLQLEGTGLILRGNFTGQIGAQEWCERRLLARIHRLTLGKLRKEIAPVTAGEFMRWLLRWQHVLPGKQLQGEQGLLEIVRQFQGYEIPANAWERQIFAKRVGNYTTDLLDRLTLSGAIGWGRLSPHPSLDKEEEGRKKLSPTSVAPITFFIREESDWMSSHELALDTEKTRLSHTAKLIYEFLSQKGASFFTDIVNGVKRLKTEIETGLWELVAAGLVTADGYDSLRALIDPKRRANKVGRRKTFRFATGRWSILRTEGEIDKQKQIEAVCWVLLKRYGVVFRDLLAREKNIPRWRELLIAFRRLEEQGEVRGGRFVSGFIGEQFALPYAVDSLRAITKTEPEKSLVTLSAADPLNLWGIILPGDRISAISGKKIVIDEQTLVSQD